MSDEIDAAREMMEKFGDQIRADVAKWPPLSQEQKDRLRVILRPVRRIQKGVMPTDEQQ